MFGPFLFLATLTITSVGHPRLHLDVTQSTTLEPATSATWATQSYSSADGLADMLVSALAVHPDGRLWVGTQNGPAEFANGRFASFTLASRSLFVRALCAQPDGTWWIGTAGGGVVRRGTDGKDTVLRLAEGLPSDDITALGCAASEVWIGTSQGMRVFRNGVVAWPGATHALADASIQAIEMFDGGAALVTNTHLFIQQSGAWTERAKVAGIGIVKSLALEGESAWVGGDTGLLRVSLADGEVAVHPDQKLGQVYALAVTSRGLVVGSHSGRVSLCQRNNCRELATLDGAVQCMKRDVRGREVVWIGTDAGLHRFALSGWRHFKPEFKSLHDRISAMTASKDGVWLGTPSGLTLINEKEVRDFTAKTPEPAPQIVSLHKQDNGQVLAGSKYGALFELTPRGPRDVSVPFAPYETIWAIGGTTDERLLATRVGLFKQDDLGEKKTIAWKRVDLGTHSSTPTWAVASWLEANRAVQTWVAAETRIVVLSAQGLTELGTEQGLHNDNGLSMLAENVDGHTKAMWVGTDGGGLYRFTKDSQGKLQSRAFLPSQDLPNGVINSLVMDKAGRLYVGTSQGVARLQCLDSMCDKHHIEVYTREDGLPDDETIMGAAAITIDGRVYMGTAKGLAVLEPDEDVADTKTKPLYLAPPSVNDEAAPFAGLTQLDHHLVSLRFDWALLSYFRDHESRYQTQLWPLERTPRPWEALTRREFTGLNHGDYEFRVWGRDYAGNVTGPRVVPLSIAAPPWLTPWAYAAYLITFGASIVALGRARIRQLQKRAAELERIVEERTRDVVEKAAEIQKQKEELEASYKEADLIFQALREALKGSLLNDRYRLEDELGVGGFGVVYRAVEVRTGELFAVKVFRPQSGNDSTDSLERFKLEGKTSARIVHKHAIRVFEHGVTKDGIAYIVMELLNGTSVQSELDKTPCMPWRRSLQIVRDATKALAFAHELGVIHRDIKPDNIFLHHTPDGKELVKVLDFGVAKANQNAMTMAMRSLTMSGQLVGTPYYLAPERIQGDKYDGRSDIYAMGVMLYQMLAGKVPFGAADDNMFSAVLAHLNSPIPELPEKVLVNVPPAIAALVRRALDKDPSERLAATEFVAQIDALLSEDAHDASSH